MAEQRSTGGSGHSALLSGLVNTRHLGVESIEPTPVDPESVVAVSTFDIADLDALCKAHKICNKTCSLHIKTQLLVGALIKIAVRRALEHTLLGHVE